MATPNVSSYSLTATRETDPKELTGRLHHYNVIWIDNQGQLNVYRYHIEQATVETDGTQTMKQVALTHEGWSKANPLLQQTMTAVASAATEAFHPDRFKFELTASGIQVEYSSSGAPPKTITSRDTTLSSQLLRTIEQADPTPVEDILSIQETIRGQTEAEKSNPKPPLQPDPTFPGVMSKAADEFSDLALKISPTSFEFAFKSLEQAHSAQAQFIFGPARTLCKAKAPKPNELTLDLPPLSLTDKRDIFLPFLVDGRTVLLYRRATKRIGRQQWRYYDPMGKTPLTTPGLKAAVDQVTQNAPLIEDPAEGSNEQDSAGYILSKIEKTLEKQSPFRRLKVDPDEPISRKEAIDCRRAYGRKFRHFIAEQLHSLPATATLPSQPLKEPDGSVKPLNLGGNVNISENSPLEILFERRRSAPPISPMILSFGDPNAYSDQELCIATASQLPSSETLASAHILTTDARELFAPLPLHARLPVSISYLKPVAIEPHSFEITPDNQLELKEEAFNALRHLARKFLHNASQQSSNFLIIPKLPFNPGLSPVERRLVDETFARHFRELLSTEFNTYQPEIVFSLAPDRSRGQIVRTPLSTYEAVFNAPAPVEEIVTGPSPVTVEDGTPALPLQPPEDEPLSPVLKKSAEPLPFPLAIPPLTEDEKLQFKNAIEKALADDVKDDIIAFANIFEKFLNANAPQVNDLDVKNAIIENYYGIDPSLINRLINKIMSYAQTEEQDPS